MAAVLFPGQGSQFVGMLDGILRSSKLPFSVMKRLQQLVLEADEIVGYPLSQLIQDGPIETLSRTRYTQPALFLTSTLHWLQWQWTGEAEKEDKSNKVKFAIGHSIGEFAALHVAGILDFRQGLLLTDLRGKLMEETVPLHNGKQAMLAVIAQDINAKDNFIKWIEGLCDERVSLAAINSERQVVVSGLGEDLQRWKSQHLTCTEKIITRWIPKINRAFHSSLMEEAATLFYQQSQKILGDLYVAPDCSREITVIANTTAQPMSGHLRSMMRNQMINTVRWHDSILRARQLGCQHFYCISPGPTLMTLMRQSHPKVVVEQL